MNNIKLKVAALLAVAISSSFINISDASVNQESKHILAESNVNLSDLKDLNSNIIKLALSFDNPIKEDKTIDQPETADTVDNQSNLTVTERGSLTVTNDFKNEDSGTVKNEGLISGNDLKNDGKFENGVKDDGQGSVTLSGTLTNGATEGSSSASLTNKGTFTVQGSGSNSNKGTITNEGGSFVVNGQMTNDGSIENKNSSGGTEAEMDFYGGLTNSSGSINNGSGAGLTVTGDFTNGTSGSSGSSGSITNSGNFTFGNMTNNGTFTQKDGTVTSSGTVTNNSGGNITVEGGTFGAKDLTNKGKFDNQTGGTTTIQDAINNETGTLTNSGSLSANSLTNTGSITNSSTKSDGFSIEGEIKNQTNGTFTNSNGANLKAGSITNESQGKDGKKGFSNSGNVNAGSFTNKNGGSAENTGSGQLTLSGEFKNGETKDGSTFTNSGTITASGDITNNGTFSNSNTDGVGSVTGSNVTNNGTFTNTNGSVTAEKDLTNSGKFENKGTGTVAVEGNLKNTEKNSEFTNENTVTVNGAEGVTNSGKFNNLGDAQLTVQNGNFKNETGGNVENSGSISVVTGGLDNLGDFTNTGESADLSITGALKNETGGNFKNDKGATAKIGDVENSGSIDNQTDSNLTFSGTVTGSSGAITNSGNLTLNGDASGYKGTFNQTQGTTTVGESSKFFSGKSTVTGGKIDWKSGQEETITDLEMSGGEFNVEGSGKLTLSGNTKIENDVTVKFGEKSDITLKDGTNEECGLYLNEDDEWKGTVHLKDGGHLYYGITDETKVSGTLDGEAGDLHLLEGSVFTFKGEKSNIKDAVNVEIKKGSTLKVSENAKFNMDSGDTWAGLVDLENGGNLNATGVDNTKDGGGIKQGKGGTSVFSGSNVVITDSSSSITGGTVELKDNSKLTYGGGQKFSADDLIIESGSTFGTMNGYIDSSTSEELQAGGEANFTFDISQRKYESDQFDIGSKGVKLAEGVDSGNLHISDFNLLGDCPVDRHTKFQFFNIGESEIPEGIEFTATSQIKRTPSGWFGLNPVDGMEGYYDLYLAAYVPEEFRGITAILGMYTNQLQVNDIVTNHFILHDSTLIDKAKNANKYSAVSPLFAPYQKTYKDGGIWSKSYASFDRMDLTQGLSVGNNTYGTLLGADLPAVELNNDWTFIPTGYVGYNGAHQYFDGVSSYQNAGQLGVMGTFIRDEDFITSVTAYGGGYTNEMSYGGYNDNTGNWFAGSAVKTAYNLHALKDFIIQPNLMVAYNAFGRQNWHSDYGNIDMLTKMFNGINVAPGVNFILSKDTWSLYATCQYMFFINDKVDAYIGNIHLPDTKLEHGVFQYGIGGTKTFSDTFATYGQINLRNAGITGIGFQLGLQWLFDLKLPWTHKANK